MIYLITMIAALTGFLFGFDEGIMSGALTQIQKDFGINDKQTGFMMGLFPFGAFLTACVAGRLSDLIGRVKVLFLIPLVFSLSILMIVFSSTFSILCIARFLLGVSIGMSVVVSPLYIAETAPAEIRGKLGTYFQLAIAIGILCSDIINLSTNTEHLSWRTMFGIELIPSGLLFIGVFFLPESPRWLCIRKRDHEASVSLCKILGIGAHSARLEKEIALIEHSIQRENKKSVWKDLFSKKIRPCLSLGIFLFFFQQLSGINVIIYYAPIIFKNMHLGSSLGSLLATVGVGVVNVAMTFAAMQWVEKMGRRHLLLIGFVGTAAVLFTVAITTYLNDPSLHWLSATCIFIYIAFFAISLGPLPWVMMPEIFPQKVRGQGSSFSAASNWAINTAVVASFPIMQQSMGISATFAVYGIACLIGFFWAMRYIPETRNLSLEQIETHVYSGRPLRELGMRKKSNM